MAAEAKAAAVIAKVAFSALIILIKQERSEKCKVFLIRAVGPDQKFSALSGRNNERALRGFWAFSRLRNVLTLSSVLRTHPDEQEENDFYACHACVGAVARSRASEVF